MWNRNLKGNSYVLAKWSRAHQMVFRTSLGVPVHCSSARNLVLTKWAQWKCETWVTQGTTPVAFQEPPNQGMAPNGYRGDLQRPGLSRFQWNHALLQGLLGHSGRPRSLLKLEQGWSSGFHITNETLAFEISCLQEQWGGKELLQATQPLCSHERLTTGSIPGGTGYPCLVFPLTFAVFSPIPRALTPWPAFGDITIFG